MTSISNPHESPDRSARDEPSAPHTSRRQIDSTSSTTRQASTKQRPRSGRPHPLLSVSLRVIPAAACIANYATGSHVHERATYTASLAGGRTAPQSNNNSTIPRVTGGLHPGARTSQRQNARYCFCCFDLGGSPSKYGVDQAPSSLHSTLLLSRLVKDAPSTP